VNKKEKELLDKLDSLDKKAEITPFPAGVRC
jgi:hypothetical protein